MLFDIYSFQALGALALGVFAALVALGPPAEKGSAFKLEPAKGSKRHITPILLVHGMGCGAWIFGELAKRLSSQGFEVHCITMSKSRFKTIDQYIEEIRCYIEANMVEGPVLLGHSLGGMLIQHYALNVDVHQPPSKRVKGLVFAASFGSHGLMIAIRSILSVFRMNLIGCLWSLVRFNGKFVAGTSFEHSAELMFLPSTKSTNVAGEGDESLESCFLRTSPLESGLVLFDLLRVLATSSHATSPAALGIKTLSVVPLQDRLLLPWTQRAMAEFWSSEVIEVPGQGHFLGDKGWEMSYATPLASWLEGFA